MNKNKKNFAAIGECMIELRHQNDSALAMNFAGDTLNTSLYLARYQDQLNLSVDYVTALGNDSYSTMMREAWQQEGIGTRFVQQLDNRLPGLYLIKTDPEGERQFYYYRSQSAARQLFYTSQITAIKKKLLTFDYLYLSGISLAILDAKSRAQLFRWLHHAQKKGVQICFDTNYRARLWENKTTAKSIINQIMSTVSTALVTFDDEKQLFGDKSPERCAARLHKHGVQEVVIKLGEAGCFLSSAGSQIYLPVGEKIKVVDSTAAGDSFNAGYLGGRIKGLTSIESAKAAQRLAATVIAYPGAIIPREAMPVIY